MALRDFKRKGNRSLYFFDTYEYARWFPQDLKIEYIFGDVIDVPATPKIVKSRPIDGDRSNSVLLNLDKLRHFTFMKDKKKFSEKRNIVIFRGRVGHKLNRLNFMKQFFDHPMVDAGVIAPSPDFPLKWSLGKKINLKDHLDYKFVMALEGNDVATNLKWIMASNSVAVTPKMRYETWFMEGRLIPNHHYIEIADDFSDLEERLNYYLEHPNEAEKIVRNANQYVKQFLNPKRERLISLLLLDKYFKNTEQK